MWSNGRRGTAQLRHRDEETMLELAHAFAGKLDDSFRNQVQAAARRPE